MKLESLRSLYVHQLKDLYSAETQILEALPALADAATDPKLRSALEAHAVQTQEHVDRLEQIFDGLEFAPGGQRCKGMEGLLEEGRHFLEGAADPHVRDAGLIAAAQRVEHYEIAGYGTARAFAEQLGEFQAADLLTRTLEDEGAADRALTHLADRRVNAHAVGVGMDARSI